MYLLHNRRIHILIGVLALFAVIALLLLSGGTRDDLRVVFFDVGQGDSIFIEAPNGAQMLIDGGASPVVLQGLSQELGFFDRDLDVVLATHLDADHIGGLVDVLERYDVETVVLTRNKSESVVARAFLERVHSEGAQVVYAQAGTEVALGAAALEVLFPRGDAREMESNTSSIVAQLTYDERAFLFTGDSPDNIESYLADTYGVALASDVLKVGHHGSRTSTEAEFVEMVAPEYAVISAGADNSYGHPHQEVIDILKVHGITIFETASAGSVIFETDGKRLWRK